MADLPNDDPAEAPLFGKPPKPKESRPRPIQPPIPCQTNGTRPPAFKLARWRTIKTPKEPNYLVQGLVPREGLVVVYGPPKCGKTFWTFDLVAHVALGWPYRGRRVEKGTVVYIACEGERGLAARKEAFQQERLAEDADPSFFLLTTRLDLPAQVDELVLDVAGQMQPPGAPVSAIVFDTLNRSFSGSESRDEDMTKYIAAADTLRERFRCAVIIIHHTGIDGGRPRGHTSLTGAVDAQIVVKRTASGLISATLEWMKDGPEGIETLSRLKVITLGQDDNGEYISSCVIEPVEAETVEATAAKKRNGNSRLSPKDKIVFDILAGALALHGRPPPEPNGDGPEHEGIPPSATVISTELLRRLYLAKTNINGQTEHVRRVALNRSIERLMAANICLSYEVIWLP